MRTVILSLALVTGLFGVYGCQGTDNQSNAAIQALENPPNACGPGGSQDIEDCNNGR